MSLKLHAEDHWCRLYVGDSREYDRDDVDLVLTNPYGPLPDQLRSKDMILSHSVDRLDVVREWARPDLHEIGRWNTGSAHGREQAVWSNLEIQPPDLEAQAPEMFEASAGWWPLDLPLRLLLSYDKCDRVVWDGFAGRGTTGRACQLLGLHFVGIDKDPARVELMRRYLGVEG
jgi:hypothetical protein